MTTEEWVRSAMRAGHSEAMRINAFFSGVLEGASFALVGVINSGAPSAASLDAGLTIFEDKFLPHPIKFTHQAVNNFRNGVVRAAKQFGNAILTNDTRAMGFGVGAVGVGFVGTRNSFGGPLPNFANANVQQQTFMVTRALDRLHHEEGITLHQYFLFLRGKPDAVGGQQGILEKFNQLRQGNDIGPSAIGNNRFGNIVVTDGSHTLIARELFTGPLSPLQCQFQSCLAQKFFGALDGPSKPTRLVNIYNRNQTSTPLSIWGGWPSLSPPRPKLRPAIGKLTPIDPKPTSINDFDFDQ